MRLCPIDEAALPENCRSFQYRLVRVSRDGSRAYGALRYGDKAIFEAYIPRDDAAYGVRLELRLDGGSSSFYNMQCVGLQLGCDVYSCEFDPDVGLYFIKISFDSPEGKRYMPNLRDGGDEFQLTVYPNDFSTPASLKGGTIYQIFPDRFAKSAEHPTVPHDNAVINDDWYGGIPKYPDKPGDEVDCNDFFGGSLWGIAEKLDYLASLGVTHIYLNPIFEAHTNHRYDTGDYTKVDGMLGGCEALDHLIAEGKKRGIGIILDGVFGHTGSDSRYFNREGRYPTKGAYSSKRSRYYSWYTFRDYPDDYECWWGVKILPTLNKHNVAVRDFFCSENGIAARYIERGIAGWRLDVADELPDEFLDELRVAVKAKNPEAVIIGEVWEDASNKIAYGARRRYFTSGQIDSVMNYPLREAIIAFVTGGGAERLRRTAECLYERYPKCVSDVLMNMLGNHDTERILNILGSDSPEVTRQLPNVKLSTAKLTAAERKRGIGRLKLAALLCATLPGVPSVYYGDEAGLEGWRDPFNRRCYPWGREDNQLVEHYRKLGKIRSMNREFADGEFEVLYANDGLFIFRRESIVTAVNASSKEYTLAFPGKTVHTYTELMSNADIADTYKIDSMSGAIFAAKK